MFIFMIATVTMGHIDSLNYECVNSKIKGIEIDIGRCENWLSNQGIPDDKKESLKDSLAVLQKELEKANKLKIKIETHKIKSDSLIFTDSLWVRGTINSKFEPGIMITYDKMSRSGPFYHIAGINSLLSSPEPTRRYDFLIYVVQTRMYPFPDFYVYLKDFKEIEESKENESSD